MKEGIGRTMGAALVAAAALCAQVLAQVEVTIRHRFAENIVLPQSRAISFARPAERVNVVQITAVGVVVAIRGQVATTTMDIDLKNPTRARQEAELIVPVPDGAVVRGFTFQGAGKEPAAQLMPADEARRTYEAIVARVRDPALLEFLGYNLIRSSVFPVEANGAQKVRLTYEHLLKADGDRVDYMLPRSESLDYKIPWKVSVKIDSQQPVATVYSPSHKLDTTRAGPGKITARIAADAVEEPGPFRLSYLLEAKDGISASLFAYPYATTGGGYFLLLAGLPVDLPDGKDGPAIKREVTLVLDHSGSMRGEKLDQVREAALQILAGLEPGETFNIIVYNEIVELFAPRPVIKSAETVDRATAFLAGVRASGGTNIHDALLEALRQKPDDSVLPIVLFLTDGLPTMGQTSEVAIRNVAIKANPHSRRVFTFGVGVNVNTPLLDKIASETRATATFVLPKEDVEVKVAGVFKRLAGPVLAEPILTAADRDSRHRRVRIKEVLPAALPDLFEGDQLVVLGRYVADEPVEFRLAGNYLGTERRFQFGFDVGDVATTRNAFVPRLWASRKIGMLLEAIRALGADTGTIRSSVDAPAVDPRIKELVDEIVRLSTEFGILTEYTAFLAREGTDLGNYEALLLEANRNFHARNATRYGLAAVNQENNKLQLMSQTFTNGYNWQYDQDMNRVANTGVQQVSDRAFYRRPNGWTDGRLVGKHAEVKPTKVIDFGSKEFFELARRLADEGRQSTIALRGEILMKVDDQTILVRN